MNEELKNNALNDDDLEQVTGGKKMRRVNNEKGSRITATAAGKAAAVANGKANIAEAAAVAYANEN